MTSAAPDFDELFPDRPWTVCFYSFRGGVGRTTLAVSTALTMRLDYLHYGDKSGCPQSQIDRSRRTAWGRLKDSEVWIPGTLCPDAIPGALLLDFDLEAPGIDEFEQLRPPSPEQKGLVEYICDYRRTGVAPALADYVYRAGDVWVMRSGRRNAEYRKFLAKIDWDDFCRNEEGFLFFENLRAGVLAEFRCPTLLVDSRTGLTEIGGMCLGHLADAVVLVFQPTTAHQQGLIDVVHELRKREQRQERWIPRLYVASRVPRLYESGPDGETARVIRETVSRCENGARFCDLTDLSWDPLAGSELFDVNYNEVDVLAIPQRGQVRDPHRPDAHVVITDGDIAEYVSDKLKLTYRYVAAWVDGAYGALEDELRKRADARRATTVAEQLDMRLQQLLALRIDLRTIGPPIARNFVALTQCLGRGDVPALVDLLRKDSDLAAALTHIEAHPQSGPSFEGEELIVQALRELGRLPKGDADDTSSA